MEHRRRFIFHAHAAPFGGHIIRPKDIVLESTGASALPVTGGRCVGNASRRQFEEFFRVDSVDTGTEGLFEDREQFRAFTNRPLDERVLAALTHAWADVKGLVIGRKPRLTVAHVRGELHARSPLGSGEPSIRVDEGSVVEGVDIDGHKLIVQVDCRPFQKFDTHSKLRVAADDPDFVKESGALLYMTTAIAGHSEPPTHGRLLDCNGTIHSTIVKSLRWDGDPFPGATIDHNMVAVPNFGRIFFGELLITGASRRLTMVRCALGSDSGGTASAADVQDNGMWSN